MVGASGFKPPASWSRTLNVKKRAGDWVDAQQLIYLSDSKVHFVTADNFIKEWASASKQSDRIFNLSEFIKHMGF